MEEKSAGDCSSELFWSAQRLTGKKNPVRQKRERNSFNVNGGSFIYKSIQNFGLNVNHLGIIQEIDVSGDDRQT
jgi:hypothetical protein